MQTVLHMALTRHLPLAAALVLAASTVAAAQPAPAGTWIRGSTISLFAGLATASSDTGGLAGGAAGFEITPWFGVEGSAAWLDRRGGAEAFAAALTVHASLKVPRPAVPFVKGGVGLYRASFGSSADDLPDFYRRRLGPGEPAVGTSHTFRDPSFVVGGGINLFATRHIALRPEIEAMVVRRESRNHVVTAVTMHVAYHFEDHPVTPARVRARGF